MFQRISALVVFMFTLNTLFAQEKALFKAAVLGFYNVENLYDTLDNPITDDAEFLPNGAKKYNSEIYNFKLGRLAEVISQLGTEITPDGVAIMGLCEVENREVLQDLVQQPKLLNRNFGIVHFDSPDRRGVDVALLYQPKYFKVLNARPLEVIQYEDKDTARRYTRDILYVAGLLDGDTVHLFVNHWPSRRGGEGKSAKFRIGAAQTAKLVIDSIMLNNPTAKIVLMGDLNDDPINKSVCKVLGAQEKVTETGPRGLYNATWGPFKQGIGTLAYNDAWNLFDQMVVSYGLVSPLASGYTYKQVRVFNEPWLAQQEGTFEGYPWRTYVGNTFKMGYSDHFPVYITLVKQL